MNKNRNTCQCFVEHQSRILLSPLAIRTCISHRDNYFLELATHLKVNYGSCESLKATVHTTDPPRVRSTLLFLPQKGDKWIEREIEHRVSTARDTHPKNTEL